MIRKASETMPMPHSHHRRTPVLDQEKVLETTHPVYHAQMQLPESTAIRARYGINTLGSAWFKHDCLLGQTPKAF